MVGAGRARALTLGPDHVLVGIGVFFSKLAVVSFGGAYALLAYMAQEAVETQHWMTAPEMVDGLGLAETTPGPLILVTQFVGFLAAFRDAAPFSRRRRRNRCGDDDVGDVRAIDAVDFRRRAVHRAAARQPAAVRRAGRHHRRRGRRHPQPVGVVRAACAVRTGARSSMPAGCAGTRSTPWRSISRRRRWPRSRRCWRSACIGA